MRSAIKAENNNFLCYIVSWFLTPQMHCTSQRSRWVKPLLQMAHYSSPALLPVSPSPSGSRVHLQVSIRSVATHEWWSRGTPWIWCHSMLLRMWGSTTAWSSQKQWLWEAVRPTSLMPVRMSIYVVSLNRHCALCKYNRHVNKTLRE